MRSIARLIVLALLPTAASAADWRPAPTPLATRWGREVTPDNAWREYPRPQLVREAWQSLNGLWDYAVVDRPAGEAGPPRGDGPPPAAWDGKILVPFCVESSLSGVGRPVTAGQLLWYRRRVAVPAAWSGRRIMLRFDAVDWHATAWLNGKRLGDHAGGSDPFAFDITPHLRPGDNELVLRVWDPTDAGPQPRGKQVMRPESIWYTAVTGIWQSVWLEPVPEAHVTGVFPLVTVATAERGEVECAVEVDAGAAAPARVRIVGGTARQGRCILGTAAVCQPIRFVIEQPRLWTPDDPHLYEVEVELLAADEAVIDRAKSYFAVRSIAVGKDEQGIPRLLLNGRPLFQIGPLDQGWWPDGLLTPPSDAAMRYDLEVLKRLGMNMLRKHIKVEPARYYHHCDRLGLLVWQDQPSGMQAGRKHAVKPEAAADAEFTPEEKTQFRAELGRMIDRLRFFPSIVAWVPFNEGWGQQDTNDVLRWVKDRDPTRLVDGPSGWTDRGWGDMKDMHAYPGPDMFPPLPDRVSVLGEFGGLGLPVKGHLWKDADNWGYKTFQSEAELRAAYGDLIEKLRPLVDKGLAAAVYTQTTDVEIEVNGLLTYDRAVLKFDVEQMAAWHRALVHPPAGERR
ncbi:MAG: glycoside hydrolase family 2 protein [Planctomycetia bacterium]